MKPDNEMLLMVLEKKQSATGKDYYVGFMGLNTVYASESNGKLFVNLQKWPRKDAPADAPKKESAPAQKVDEEDVPF